MKFAFLGLDPLVLPLAKAAASSTRHAIAWIGDLGDDQSPLQGLALDVVPSPHWESLLAGDVADVVVVARARDGDARADQIRKLLQSGVPLLVSHPIHDSSLVC